MFVSEAGQQEKEQGGSRKMKDLMPSIKPQEEEEEEEDDVVMEMGEPLSAAADTDSSTNDVFWLHRTYLIIDVLSVTFNLADLNL